jgi:hypothetical protein
MTNAPQSWAPRNLRRASGRQCPPSRNTANATASLLKQPRSQEDDLEHTSAFPREIHLPSRPQSPGTNRRLGRWESSRSPIPPPRARPVTQGVAENGCALTFSANALSEPSQSVPSAWGIVVASKEQRRGGRSAALEFRPGGSSGFAAMSEIAIALIVGFALGCSRMDFPPTASGACCIAHRVTNRATTLEVASALS